MLQVATLIGIALVGFDAAGTLGAGLSLIAASAGFGAIETWADRPCSYPRGSLLQRIRSHFE